MVGFQAEPGWQNTIHERMIETVGTLFDLEEVLS
jgi:hypothetical protein